MNLKVVEHKGSDLPIGGILIRGAGPLVWLKEIERMHLDIAQVEIYAIPSNTANELFGCLLISSRKLLAERGPNTLIRHMHEQLYLLDNTAVFPSLVRQDFEQLFKNSKYFLHPEIGLVELSEKLDFKDLISCQLELEYDLKKPLSGVYIPSELKSFRLDINPEDVMKSMFSDISDGKDEGKVPFNLNKVLKGNEKEIAKYLDFLDKNPHLAMKYAIPLDLIGTSRGTDYANFYFKEDGWFNNLLEELFSKLPNSNSSNKNTSRRDRNTSNSDGKKVRNGIFIFILVIIALGRIGSKMQENSSITEAEYINFDPLSTDTLENDSTSESIVVPPIQESLQEEAESNGPFTWHNGVIGLVLILLLFLIFKYLINAKVKSSNGGSNPLFGGGGNSPPTSILPVDIDWENFNSKKESSVKRISGFYFGKEDYTPFKGILAYAVLLGVLCYMFYPILGPRDIGPWYTIAIILIGVVMFRLFRAEMTLLKPENEKEQSFKDKFFNVVLVILFFKFITVGSFFFTMAFSKFIVQFVLFVVFTFLSLLLLTLANSDKSTSSHAGSAIIGDNSMSRLNSKYLELANNYLKNKEYQKAAYIHMKLLQNPYKAAQILEEGKMYTFAASIYLKQCHVKEKAASCYELAMQYQKAIELYLELENDEKVGDIYMLQKNEEKAFSYYDKVIQDHKNKSQYLKAALLARKKKSNEKEAKSILLSGWRLQKDGYNCLNNYFAGFKNEDTLSEEIEYIYNKEVDENNRVTFLRVLKKEYPKHENMKGKVRQFAYEIISNLAKKNYMAVEELKFFNPKDKMLKTDINRYKSN